MHIRFFGLLAVALMAAACNSPLRPPVPPQAVSAVSAVSPGEVSTVLAVPAPALLQADAAFSKDALYELLAAEFALGRNLPAITLHHYSEQLRRTRDPAIAERTAEIAGALGLHGLEMEAVKHRIAAMPNDGVANLALARIVLQTGEPEEARPYLVAAIAAGLRIRYQRLALAVSSRLAVDRRAAFRVFRSLPVDPQDTPQYTEWLQAQALLLEGLGEARQALSLLREAGRAASPQNSGPILAEVMLLERMHQSVAARRRLEEALALNPTRALRWHYAAMLSTKEPEAALQQLEILVRERPDDYAALFSLAMLNWETGHLDIAERHFHRLLAVGFRPDLAHFHLGRLADLRGDEELAIEHYLAVSSGPQLPAAARYLGALLMREDRIDEMQAMFARQRFYHERQTLVFYLLEAGLLVDGGQWQRGRLLLKKGLHRHPGNKEMLYLYALTELELGNFSKAEQNLRALLQADAEDPRFLNALGYSLADRTARYEEAYELIHRAFIKRPEDPAILDSMGWVHYRMGHLQTALEYLQRAISLQPDHEIAAHLGEVLWMMGHREQAHKVWEDAMQAKPDSAILRATVERMKHLAKW